jgi:hypothetical protein
MAAKTEWPLKEWNASADDVNILASEERSEKFGGAVGPQYTFETAPEKPKPRNKNRRLCMSRTGPENPYKLTFHA